MRVLCPGLMPKRWFDAGKPKLSPASRIVDHFPEAEKDGSMVVWAHGTNNKIKLLAAVNSSYLFQYMLNFSNSHFM